MKDDINGIDKARRLLEAWYEGTADRADEAWLERFFSASGSLPDDLEAERGMFMAIHEVASQRVVMPEEHKRRIEEALDSEIRRESVWHRRRILWGAAACMLLASGVTFMMRHVGTGTQSEAAPLAQAIAERPASSAGGNVDCDNVAGDNVKADNDTSVLVASLNRQEEGMLADNRPSDKSAYGKYRAAVKSGSGKVGKDINGGKERVSTEVSVQDVDNQTMYACSYTPEEEEMMARGYRVVSNDAEAQAVVGLVIAKMQENAVETAYVMDEAAYRFDKVMSRPI